MGRSIPPRADIAGAPNCASAGFPSEMPLGGSGDASIANACPSRAAQKGDLRGQGFHLGQRRRRHRLDRRCDNDGKGGSSDQPDHWVLPTCDVNTPTVRFPGRERLMQINLSVVLSSMLRGSKESAMNMKLSIAFSALLAAGFITTSTKPADAVVYCQYVSYPAGCVARPGVVLRARPVARAAVVGGSMNRGGPVNRVGRR
jgi:hypothetical protein